MLESIEELHRAELVLNFYMWLAISLQAQAKRRRVDELRRQAL